MESVDNAVKLLFSLFQKKLGNVNQDDEVHELNVFPYLLFKSELQQELSKLCVKYTFSMHRREFKEKLQPLLQFCSYDEFEETFYDDEKHTFMNNNIWVKKVGSIYSVKTITTIIQPSTSLMYYYPEIKEIKLHLNTDSYLLGMLEVLQYILHKFKLKVHRTQFQFKQFSNIKLNLDRVTFDNESKAGYVIYSLFSDVSTNLLENISANEYIQNQLVQFKDDMKPCRSKIIQLLYENEETRNGIYNDLMKNGTIPHQIDYETISLLQYEAERVKIQIENYNKDDENNQTKKSEEFINIMYRDALAGNSYITATTEDEDDNTPYYSDHE